MAEIIAETSRKLRVYMDMGFGPLAYVHGLGEDLPEKVVKSDAELLDAVMKTFYDFDEERAEKVPKNARYFAIVRQKDKGDLYFISESKELVIKALEKLKLEPAARGYVWKEKRVRVVMERSYTE